MLGHVWAIYVETILRFKMPIFPPRAPGAQNRVTRRRMARERRGAGSSLVSMETQFYKQYMKDVL